MHRSSSWAALAAVVAACGSAACGAAGGGPARPSEPSSCAELAAAIETLRPQFPALVEYRASTALHRDCVIEYGWHTHRATPHGGWSSGVPNPDPDGVWFYFSAYDPHGPDAGAQINTQPVMPERWLGPRKVTFLILTGSAASGLPAALADLLRQHGVRG